MNKNRFISIYEDLIITSGAFIQAKGDVMKTKFGFRY